MTATLYTIGYQQRSIDDYVHSLASVGVTVVVDVREVAWSNRREYAKGSLSRHLESSGIRYVHLPTAGNPKRIRASVGSRSEQLDMYAEYLNETGVGIDDLIEILESNDTATVAITCYERDAHECHRSILTSMIGTLYPGINVVHM